MTRSLLKVIGVALFLSGCSNLPQPVRLQNTADFQEPTDVPLQPVVIAPSETPGSVADSNSEIIDSGANTDLANMPTTISSDLAVATSVPISVDPARLARQTRLANVHDWLYQLQNLDVGQVSASNFDLLVTDYAADGSSDTRFTPETLAALKQGPQGERIVLSYMSIGEAEDYRFYWTTSWDDDPRDGVPDADAPAWLDVGNEAWCGLPDWCNYKVRFWDPNWQSVIYGSPNAYMDQIIDAGFDGVYLDIIDAYYYYESTEGRASAAQEMVAFVRGLADYARITRGKSEFMIFPQNGEELAAIPEFLEIIDGIGKEDIFYDGDELQPSENRDWVLSWVRQIRDSGGLVLSVDYVTQPALINEYYNIARQERFAPYATDRDLGVMTINAGFEP